VPSEGPDKPGRKMKVRGHPQVLTFTELDARPLEKKVLIAFHKDDIPALDRTITDSDELGCDLYDELGPRRNQVLSRPEEQDY
jgi:hypothetical protein